MALTKTDLQQIRIIMGESINDGIAVHPRFDEMKTEIITQVTEQVTDQVTDQVSELVTDALELIDNRFNIIEARLDNLRIVSR